MSNTIQPGAARPRRRARAAATPLATDALDIALEADATGKTPDGIAGRLLHTYERLARRQILSESFGLALQALAGASAVALALSFILLVISAAGERGLVIEPFSVPPELAQKGVTGKVVANRVLDRLGELQARTVSYRPASTYANNWNGDIQVVIPQTGVSVGELRRTLVEWLGHQTSIGGELYRTPSGLVLTARAGAAAPSPQAGRSEAELDALISRSAESIYATTQPYRYAIYLNREGGDGDRARAADMLSALTEAPDATDRLWAHAGLNIVLQGQGDDVGAVRASLGGIEADPHFGLAWANLADALRGLGADEAAVEADQQAIANISHGRRYFDAPVLAFLAPKWRAAQARQLGDYRASTAELMLARRARPGDVSTLYALANDLIARHDVAGARRVIDTLRRTLPAKVRPQALAALDAAIAWEHEDWHGVERATHAGGDAMLGEVRIDADEARLAIALARQRRFAEARRVVAALPPGCYRCTWARGVVEEAAGDPRAADRWLAAAVKQAPSLPFARVEWAKIKLARNDTAGALALLRDTRRVSPNYADAWKLEGDALSRRGDRAGATRAWRKAADLAPAWQAARQAAR